MPAVRTLFGLVDSFTTRTLPHSSPFYLLRSHIFLSRTFTFTVARLPPFTHCTRLFYCVYTVCYALLPCRLRAFPVWFYRFITAVRFALRWLPATLSCAHGLVTWITHRFTVTALVPYHTLLPTVTRVAFGCVLYYLLHCCTFPVRSTADLLHRVRLPRTTLPHLWFLHVRATLPVYYGLRTVPFLLPRGLVATRYLPRTYIPWLVGYYVPATPVRFTYRIPYILFTHFVTFTTVHVYAVCLRSRLPRFAFFFCLHTRRTPHTLRTLATLAAFTFYLRTRVLPVVGSAFWFCVRLHCGYTHTVAHYRFRGCVARCGYLPCGLHRSSFTLTHHCRYHLCHLHTALPVTFPFGLHGLHTPHTFCGLRVHCRRFCLPACSYILHTHHTPAPC